MKILAVRREKRMQKPKKLENVLGKECCRESRSCLDWNFNWGRHGRQVDPSDWLHKGTSTRRPRRITHNWCFQWDHLPLWPSSDTGDSKWPSIGINPNHGPWFNENVSIKLLHTRRILFQKMVMLHQIVMVQTLKVCGCSVATILSVQRNSAAQTNLHSSTVAGWGSKMLDTHAPVGGKGVEGGQPGQAPPPPVSVVGRGFNCIAT